MRVRLVSSDEARRIAVRAQLLDGSATTILDTVRRLGFLQIDPISTVAPPQQLVLWSRLGPYDVAELDRLLWDERKLFEWNAYVWPIESLPLVQARMRRRRRSRHYTHERWSAEFLVKNARFKRYVLGEQSVGLSHGHRLGRRIPAFGEIPQPLPPLSTGDHDDAICVEDLEHERDLAAAPPAMRLVRSGDRVVLELARRHRSVPVELAQHVALEARIALEELVSPALVRVVAAPPAAPHPRLDEWERLHRPDVRVPLEELLLYPQQPVELRDVVRPEPAPEHELLRRRDGGDRVDLQEAEPLHGVEDAGCRAVEKLCADGNAARLVWRDDPHRPNSYPSRPV